MAGGIAHVVIAKCRGGSGDAGAIRLIAGLVLLLAGRFRVAARFHGENDRADQSQHEGRDHAEHAADQRLVPPGEFLQLVDRGRRAGHDGFAPQKVPDVRRQISGAGVPPCFVLFQRLGGDDLDVSAKVCVDRTEPRRLLLADHAGDFVHGQLLEPIRQPIRQEFEQNHAERVHVRSRIQAAGVGSDLFGTHITQRAEQLAGLCATRRSQQVGRGHVGHAEVDDLGLA